MLQLDAVGYQPVTGSNPQVLRCCSRANTTTYQTRENNATVTSGVCVWCRWSWWTVGVKTVSLLYCLGNMLLKCMQHTEGFSKPLNLSPVIMRSFWRLNFFLAQCEPSGPSVALFLDPSMTANASMRYHSNKWLITWACHTLRCHPYVTKKCDHMCHHVIFRN